jgi:zinc protease
MRLASILFCSFLGITSSLSAQYKLIEKVDAESGKIVIPYAKYQLDNGLTVILHEDHSDPLVHVDVTYHVGSAREETGKSGFAHFFEHMMFQGSKHVKDEEHFKIITEAGGTLNGTTNRDRTNYFETVPSNYLETALWLESDRMGFLLDSVTQRKFEVQRETVKNERGQNYDNVPYGRVSEHISENSYPEGFPYSWLTIGYIRDLNRVGVEELQKFFLRWYGPNNAVLTIGGDLDPKQTMEWVVKYFGSIPRGPEVNDMAPLDIKEWQSTYTEDRYLTMEDKIRQPSLYLVWPSVPSYHPDAAALDLLANILGGGKASLLHAKLVKTQKAVSAFAFNSTSELAGGFSINVRAFPDQSLQEIERLVRETLAEFEARGATEDEIQSFKASSESGMVSALSSVSGKVSRLAAFQTFLGNPNQTQWMLDEINAVTKDDVMRVYQQYVKGKFAVVHSTVPQGSLQLAASAGTWKGSKGTWTGGSENYDNLKMRPVVDAFDRSKRPVAPASEPVKVPPYWTKTFKNGAAIIGSEDKELPMVTISLNFRGHFEYSVHHPNKAGVGAIAAELLNEGNSQYTAEQMTLELEKLGSSAGFYFMGSNLGFTVRSLTKNLDATMALADLRFLNREFSQEDFERAKKKALDNAKEASTRPTEIARRVYLKLLYGENHPLGIPSEGTESSLSGITFQDVKDYIQDMVRPEMAVAVVVGDIQAKAACKQLSALRGLPWVKSLRPVAFSPQIPEPGPARIYLVDKPGAPQSQIWAGYVAMPFDATGEYYRAGLMNYTLGGMFNSRLNLTLREKRGFTYGARSNFNANLQRGTWTFSTGVKAAATDSALVDFLHEVKLFRDQGIRPDELEFLKLSFNQRDALSYETPGQRVGFLRDIEWYRLSKDYVAKRREILEGLTGKEILELAQRHLPVDNMYIVVVGDKKTNLGKLKQLGLEVWEMSADGQVISQNP